MTRSQTPPGRYPIIPPKIADKLQGIQPSGEGNWPRYFPCSVTLKSGINVECVYLCEAVSWFASWGVWPENDRGKHSINVEDIAGLQSSPIASTAPVNLEWATRFSLSSSVMEAAPRTGPEKPLISSPTHPAKVRRRSRT
jgi:hypothetical protein